jgi:4'-phosphopantetheinyl transferase
MNEASLGGSAIKMGLNEAHIWLAHPENIGSPELLSRYMALLSEDEREQQSRFHFERDRHIYLVAHALVRCTLSRYAELKPHEWIFQRNKYGRPNVALEVCDLPLCFNLSHTEGLVACAVALDREIGVDVEFLERRGEKISIANQFFSPSEAKALHATPSTKQSERFFSYWTLKESYIKARGMGLSLPLHQFSFDLQGSQPIRISFEPGFQDDPHTWQFELYRPSQRHVMAFCARRYGSDKLAIQVKTTVPLRD